MSAWKWQVDLLVLSRLKNVLILQPMPIQLHLQPFNAPANCWSFSTLDSTLQKQTSNFLKNFPECSVYNQNSVRSTRVQNSRPQHNVYSPTRDTVSTLRYHILVFFHNFAMLCKISKLVVFLATALSSLQGELHSKLSMIPTRDKYSSLPYSKFLTHFPIAPRIIQTSSLSCICSVLSTMLQNSMPFRMKLSMFPPRDKHSSWPNSNFFRTIPKCSECYPD